MSDVVTVLLADSDSEVSVVSECLRRSGIQKRPLLFSRCGELIEFLSGQNESPKFDSLGQYVLLLGTSLQDSDYGMRVLQHLGSNEALRNVVPILMAGPGAESVANRYKELGYDAVLTKPVSHRGLVGALGRVGFGFALVREHEPEKQSLTELKEQVSTESALRESERRLSTLIGNLPGFVYRCRNDRDWSMEYLGGRFREVTGFDPEDLIDNRKMAFNEIISEEFHDLLWETWQTQLAKHEPVQVEYTIETADGGIKWVWEQGRGVFDDEGRLVALEGFICDTTERVHAEQETQRLRNLLKNIVDSMPSVLVGVDSECRITQWNREAEKRTGASSDEAMGRPLGDVYTQFRDDVDMIKGAIASSEVYRRTKVPCEMGEEQRLCDITIYPLAGKRSEGAVIRVDDVTDRSRVEEMMVQTEKMMSLGGLAAGMAHEINNPLAGIMQGVQNVQRRLDAGMPANVRTASECGIDLSVVEEYLNRRDVPQFLEGIREMGVRASQIVANMLQFSRKSDARMTLVNIQGLIENAIAFAAQDYDLKKSYDFRHVEIVREYDETLPSVSAVSTEIEQVLLNLLKNGAQAMCEAESDHKPRFVVRTMREGKYARIEVEDNGPGMPEEIRRRVFEPFFTTKEAGVGTGLGLSVSYMIITQNHGGTMTVHSMPGSGTKFVIRLPLGEQQ